MNTNPNVPGAIVSEAQWSRFEDKSTQGWEVVVIDHSRYGIHDFRHELITHDKMIIANLTQEEVVRVWRQFLPEGQWKFWDGLVFDRWAAFDFMPVETYVERLTSGVVYDHRGHYDGKVDVRCSPDPVERLAAHRADPRWDPEGWE